MAVSNNKTSHLISSQVPQFVKDDHETFVMFLEEYYKFLEQDNQLSNITKNFINFKDIDLAEDQFIDKLYDNFITLIPAAVLADRTLITKHIKDFYRSRGSEKSVRFLMRILFNKEVEFYYPKRDILRASDGKWFIQKSIRIGNIQVNNVANSVASQNFIAKKIYGRSSAATAVVESVDTFYDQGQLITELKLSNEYKTFINGEVVYCNFDEEYGPKYLSANLFSGIISSVSLLEGGTGYTEGTTLSIDGGGGSGGQIVISSVTKGSISSIGVSNGGAGFKANDNILVSGGQGVGGKANVYTVDLTETYHPNSYNIMASTINLEAATPINNVRYSNLNSSLVNPYTLWVQNSMSFWAYSNCGPVKTCLILNTGNHYVSPPLLDVQSNTAIRSLGILGRMEIYNGGSNYQVGDSLVFTNPIGCYGVGAAANVMTVNATGSITSVKWKKMDGHIIGGSGYDQGILPTITVSSGAGTGANIRVTAIIGDGETLVSSAASYGKILELKIISGGSGYTSTPTLNFSNLSGVGASARAYIVSGAYTYPGRFLNDDGFLSAYNFLEDKDYYQNYSYVIRVDESTSKYRKAIKDLTHPAGTKMFGHYLHTDRVGSNTLMQIVPSVTNTKMVAASYAADISDVILTGTYNVTTLSATYTPRILRATYNVTTSKVSSFTSSSTEKTLILYSAAHGFKADDNVYLKFHTAIYSNVVNGLYTISASNTNYIIVPIANGNSAFYTTGQITSNLTLSTGSGATNAWCTLSGWSQNSNVSISVGDKLYVGSANATVAYTNVRTSTIVVNPGFTGNLSAQKINVVKTFTANGNVSISNPVMTLAANNTELGPGDNVYVKFNSSDTSLINTRYVVVGSNASHIRVTHKNISSATSVSGNANIYFNTLTVTSNGHGLIENQNLYIYFYSGDTGNATNTLYTVKGVTVNTFNVTTTYPVSATGSLNYRTANVKLNITNHGFGANDSVYVWFTSGDTANISNGYYIVNVIGASQMYIPVANVLTTNGTVSVYRNYANVGVVRGNHGLYVGNTVSMLLDSGNLERISNGVYTVVNVVNSSTFNVVHTGVSVSSNLSNLLPNNSGTVYISLYK